MDGDLTRDRHPCYRTEEKGLGKGSLMLEGFNASPRWFDACTTTDCADTDANAGVWPPAA